MQLPTLRSRSEQPTTAEHFLACHIEESFVTVVIWGIEGDHTVILNQAHPKEWQDDSTLGDAIEMGLEELQDAADGVTKVLFGLPESWVINDDITDQYKEILKEVTHKLSLTPLGFVVTNEALFQHISKKDTAAAQMLFIEFTAANLNLSLVERGKRKQVEQFGRSEDLKSDLVEGLARLKEKPYPPQLYFYSVTLSESKLEEEKQLFNSYDWKADALFAHLPQVDVLSREELLRAICLTGGYEVVKALGLITTDAKNLEPSMATKPLVTASTDSHPPVEAPKEQTEEEPEYAIELDEEEVQSSRKNFLAPLQQLFKGGQGKNARMKLLGMGVVAVIILLLMSYAALSMQNSVVVTAQLKKESIFKDVQITLDPTGSTDPENNVLQATITTKEVSDTEEMSTTGTKVIGEKATGTVTLLNKTENDKSFSKGTEITADNKKFVLDEDVTVASSSAKETSDGKTLEFGKKDVKVTAAEIGAEYNLKKDTEFSVANFGKDTYAARATEDFGGGSSREIQAVSQADQNKLLSSLKESLLKKAKEELTGNLSEGQYVILTGKSTVKKQDFSAKVGDETNTVKLTMSLEVEAYRYQSDDLTPIAQTQLSSQIPEGGKLLEDTISILSKENNVGTSSAKITLDAKLSADYAPASFEDAWRQEIKGKSLEEAQRILEQKDEIESVSMQFSPSIARSLVGKLPSKESNISISVVVE